MKVQCPAKINLFLEVTGKKRNGYHTLSTVFAKINLFDTLDFQPVDHGAVELLVDNRTVAPLGGGRDNLVFRAAEAFRKEFRVRRGVRIELEKKIPIGAGLGGGSSDAAGTLVGLSRFFGLPQGRSTRAALHRLATGLGADVAFFLRPEPFALGEGIGDRLAAVEVSRTLPPMVLVYPRVPVSTAEVYRRLEIGPKSSVLTRLSQLSKLQNKLALGRPIAEWAGLLFNRLEDAVLGSCEEVLQAKKALQRLGAEGALMSGSGSSVFGFFSGPREAEKAAAKLRGYPWEVFETCCMG